MSLIRKCANPRCDNQILGTHGRIWCSRKCRRSKQQTPCAGGCGRLIDGIRGGCKTQYCRHCIRTNVWTQEKVIEAIQRWYGMFGRPPAADQWGTKEWLVDHNALWWEHPNYSTVAKLFGSWNAAINAAGFVGRPFCNPNAHRETVYV